MEEFRKAKSNLAGGSRAPSRDGHDPNANGLIRVVAVQPDGKILIPGDPTTDITATERVSFVMKEGKIVKNTATR